MIWPNYSSDPRQCGDLAYCDAMLCGDFAYSDPRQSCDLTYSLTDVSRRVSK